MRHAQTPARICSRCICIIDNVSSHFTTKTEAFLAERPRFFVHHTPKHASWLNQVELFFSILSRKLLRRGEFASRDDLVDRIIAFIHEHNRTRSTIRLDLRRHTPQGRMT